MTWFNTREENNGKPDSTVNISVPFAEVIYWKRTKAVFSNSSSSSFVGLRIFVSNGRVVVI